MLNYMALGHLSKLTVSVIFENESLAPSTISRIRKIFIFKFYEKFHLQ